jgi:murein DD-endopeptidase MepM/ murein hydrolase activator NlpD
VNVVSQRVNGSHRVQGHVHHTTNVNDKGTAPRDCSVVPRKSWEAMLRKRQFDLRAVWGEGYRMLHTAGTRRVLVIAFGSTALLALVVAGAGPFLDDYLTLRRQRESLAALAPRVAEQQALIDLYQTRVRELRAEIDSWRELHARIWEPFGPDAGPSKAGAGIGGGTASSPFENPPAPVGVKEELARLSETVREEGDNLRSLERFLGRAGKLLASLPSRWPVRGPVNSDFGQRFSPWAPTAEFHSGMDIGAPVGTAVHAPAPGRVVFAGRHPEYGIAVIIEHGGDTKSLYGHLSRLDVRVDQNVERGQVIALTGNTGRSSGPHLHYEIQVKGQSVNPHSYLWE